MDPDTERTIRLFLARVRERYDVAPTRRNTPVSPDDYMAKTQWAIDQAELFSEAVQQLLARSSQEPNDGQ